MKKHLPYVHSDSETIASNGSSVVSERGRRVVTIGQNRYQAERSMAKTVNIGGAVTVEAPILSTNAHSIARDDRSAEKIGTALDSSIARGPLAQRAPGSVLSSAHSQTVLPDGLTLTPSRAETSTLHPTWNGDDAQEPKLKGADQARGKNLQDPYSTEDARVSELSSVEHSAGERPLAHEPIGTKTDGQTLPSESPSYMEEAERLTSAMNGRVETENPAAAVINDSPNAKFEPFEPGRTVSDSLRKSSSGEPVILSVEHRKDDNGQLLNEGYRPSNRDSGRDNEEIPEPNEVKEGFAEIPTPNTGPRSHEGEAARQRTSAPGSWSTAIAGVVTDSLRQKSDVKHPKATGDAGQRLVSRYQSSEQSRLDQQEFLDARWRVARVKVAQDSRESASTKWRFVPKDPDVHASSNKLAERKGQQWKGLSPGIDEPPRQRTSERTKPETRHRSEDTARVDGHISEGWPTVAVSSNQIGGRVNAPDVAAKKHIATENDLGLATEWNRELESPNNGTEQDRKQESVACSSGTGKSELAMVSTQVEGGASAPEPTHRVHVNSTLDELAAANQRTNTSAGGSASRMLTSIREIQPPRDSRNRRGEMG